MISNKNNKLLFLDPNSEVVGVEEKVSIILSPSLYWVKKVSLPVKTTREVKKLLESLFEDLLPEGNYNYTAYKAANDGEYFIFAYEDKTILELLSQKNIPLANISSVHFAQSELSSLDDSVSINEFESMYVKDDILVVVPSSWFATTQSLDLSSVTLSKHTIPLHQFGHIVDTKTIYKIGAAILVLLLLIFSEWFITSQKNSEIEMRKDEVFAKNDLKSTMIQNRSLLKKYQKIDLKQKKIRELTSYILSLRLKQHEKMTLLNLKNNRLLVSFNGVKKSADSHITSIFKAKNIQYSSSYKNGVLHLEFQL